MTNFSFGLFWISLASWLNPYPHTAALSFGNNTAPERYKVISEKEIITARITGQNLNELSTFSSPSDITTMSGRSRGKALWVEKGSPVKAAGIGQTKSNIIVNLEFNWFLCAVSTTIPIRYNTTIQG